MQRLPPPPPSKEKLSFYRWCIAYFLLALAFGITGWYLIFSSRVGLGVVSLLGAMVCNVQSNKNFIQYRNYQDVDNEQ